MSFFAKSALALGFVSLVAADECNGVDANGVTLPADVCLNIVQGEMAYSYEYTCDDDDMGLYSVYTAADCSGDAFFTNATDDLGLNMTCGATDCDYALVTSYSYNDTWGSSTTMSPWTSTTMSGYTTTMSGTTSSGTTSSGTTTTNSGTTTTNSGTTTTNSGTTTTNSGTTTTTNSGTVSTTATTDMMTTEMWSWTTMDMETTEAIDCDDYDFPNSMEIAYAMGGCTEIVDWGAFSDIVCYEDSLYLALYNGSTCDNDTIVFAFPVEGDGECEEATCSNSVATSDPSGTTSDSDTTENPNGDGNSAASMDHLVALCFTLIALVAGN